MRFPFRLVSKMPESQMSHASTPLIRDGQLDRKPELQHSSTAEIKGSWPTLPQPVRHGIFWRACETLTDLVLMACCLAFLAFALLVRAYDGALVED